MAIGKGANEEGLLSLVLSRSKKTIEKGQSPIKGYDRKTID